MTVDGGASIVEKNISAAGTKVTFKVSFSTPGKATSIVTFKAPNPWPAGIPPEVPPDEVTHEFTVIETNLTIDSNNDGKVNDDDDTVEDSSNFVFWVNDDNQKPPDADNHEVYTPQTNNLANSDWDSDDEVISTAFDLIDLAQMRIKVCPSSISALNDAGHKIYLKLDHTYQGLHFRYFKSSKENTENGEMGESCFLSDSAKAQNQFAQTKYGNGGSGEVEIQWNDFDSEGALWLVFEGKTTTTGMTIQLVVKDSGGSELFVIDEVTVDLKNSYKFFQTYTARGTQADASYETERLEDGGTIRTATVENYPTATFESGELQGENNVLVYVHGYANTDEFSSVSFQGVFKRFYRMVDGYRGDMIAYKWEGDQLYPLFDLNVENVFESSHGLVALLKSLNQQGKTVNIAAHSLGNLVVLDALRRLRLENSTVSYVKNLIHIEAAVWNSVYYNRPTNLTTREEEQRTSWNHWCADVPGAVSGIVVNSHNTDDDALGAMVFNEIAMGRDRYNRGDIQVTNQWPTFNSWAMSRPFRTPNNLSYNKSRAPDTAATNIPIPIGDGAISLGGALNIKVTDYGWDEDSHADFRTEHFDVVYSWYKEILEYVK